MENKQSHKENGSIIIYIIAIITIMALIVFGITTLEEIRTPMGDVIFTNIIVILLIAITHPLLTAFNSINY
ncbi:hypothetical protein LCGC14_0174740 [marine sediment metagenome]|uniref:Uncharacterized protein n=1 Tax=marine sediment metagenome TaxID=412755 RepID=A0A0F9UR34_9ZZZZ